MAGTATPRPSNTKDESSLKTTTTTATTTTTTQQLPPENLKPTKLRHINAVASPMGVARTLIHLFSSSTQQRPRPPAMVAEKNNVQHLRLITIGVSHFCEKARWGLDLVQQDAVQSVKNKKDPSSSHHYYYYYTEDAHAPPFASFASVPASGDKASQTPMVVFTDDDDDNYKNDSPRRLLVGSTEILRELCPFLYPPEHRSAIMAMEDDLGRRLGATTRCIVYHHLLQPDHHDACRQVCGNAGTSSAIEAQLFRALLDKGVANAMRKFILVNEDSCAASLTELRSVFDEVSSRLNNNNNNNNNKNSSYLFGDTFTAADLTFAALAYPVLQPPATASLLGHVADNVMPPFLVDLRQELRATRAGQFALQMYQKHRFPPPPPQQQQGRSSNTPAVIALKSIGRNQWAGVRQLGTVTVGVGLVAVAARQVWQSFQ